MAYGPIHEEHSLLPDVNLREVLVLAPVLALLLVFGVFPKLLTDRIDPTAQGRRRARRRPITSPTSARRRVVQANGSRCRDRRRPSSSSRRSCPSSFLCGVAIVGLLYEAMAPKTDRRWHLALAIAGLVAAALATFPLWHWTGRSHGHGGRWSRSTASPSSRA